MKKIILICLGIAMSITMASAQLHCANYNGGQTARVYYTLTVNGQECRFDERNAYAAAEHLLKAKQCHFLSIDNADGKTVKVYKLKKKGEYAVLIGNYCYHYRDNTTLSCQLNQLDIENQLLIGGSHEGFAIGYDRDRRLILAIYKD